MIIDAFILLLCTAHFPFHATLFWFYFPTGVVHKGKNHSIICPKIDKEFHITFLLQQWVPLRWRCLGKYGAEDGASSA